MLTPAGVVVPVNSSWPGFRRFGDSSLPSGRTAWDATTQCLRRAPSRGHVVSGGLAVCSTMLYELATGRGVDVAGLRSEPIFNGEVRRGLHRRLHSDGRS